MSLRQNYGKFQTACEASPHKLQIDQWLNEGKSASWISGQLEKLGEKISDNAIGKYKRYREDRIQEELKKDPVFQRQMEVANQTLVNEVGKIKQIDVIKHIADTIDHCATLVQQAQDDEIKVRSVQDLRWIQTTMLDAIKVYGDVVMKMQAYGKIEENPDLLRPQVSVNAKNVIVDLLKGVDDNELRYKLIDSLRTGIGKYEHGGLSGDTVPDRSCELDRKQENTKGQTIFVPKS